jgi:type IV pilus assembly protein PilM
LERSIQWEAEQYIPFDIGDVYMDVQVVNQHSAQQGQMDVVLVAAKKDFVNEYTSVIMEAGLEPVVCDVDVFALETMFGANYDLPTDQTIVLVNVGASKTNVNIIACGVSSFTRDLAIGGNNLTEDIQKKLHVSQDEAEALKRSVATEDSASMRQDLSAAMRGPCDSLAADLQRSIDFFGATSADPAPSMIYLTGGTSHLAMVRQALGARTNIPVETLDPFNHLDVSGMDSSYVDSIRPFASVAVGLALRFPGDG